MLLEEGHADDVTWVIEQGAVGGFPATGFAFGCALNPQALLQSIDQFTLLQGGGFDVAMLSFLEVSGAGDVNASYLPARPHVTAGVGGFNDIITRAPKIVFSGYFTAGKKDIQIADGQLKIISDGTIAKFVPEVAQISFSGEMGRKRRQEVLYITERCVIELTEDGLTVIEIAPGVDLEKDVLAKADVPLLVSPDLQLMSAALFRPGTDGTDLVPQAVPNRRHPSRSAPECPVRTASPPYQKESSIMPATHYDYVIVGAGAAGCAVANRLSADPNTTVLLLEAGGKDWSPLVHMPVGFTKLSGPRYNWEFSTVPQPELNNREMWYPQGRTLGGSTSINAMIYIRGQKEDYEAWAELGNKHWGYDQVLPFFRRAEANERLNDRYHSSVGAVNVTEQVQHNPLSKAFVRAAQELGVTFVADFNGAVQEGVSWYDVTQKNARRESTATAYLKPIRSRKNLTVVTHALARKIIVRNGRVTGLDMIIDGKPEHVQVDRELILSGGAVNSPRLLLLSGIGPADELQPLGVPVVHDLPGVGKNLQDHMDVYLTAETTPVSYNSSDRPDKAALAGLQYITTRTGTDHRFSL